MSQFDVSPVPDANIPRTKFRNLVIDVSGVPVAVTWSEQASVVQMKHVGHSAREHLTLQLHHDTSYNTAFFQVKANLAFKSRRDRTHVFLSIRPEQIQTVACVDNDAGAALASDSLSTSSYCLQFSLKEPPALIVPHGDLTPKHRSSRLVLDSLQNLAKQTNVSVHLPTAHVTRLRLLALCEAVSCGDVHSPSKFNDLNSLYGGKGGRIYEPDIQSIATHETWAGLATSSNSGSPPSYNNSGPSPPLQPDFGQKSGTKRRRASSGSDDYMVARSHQPLPHSVEGFCKQIMDRIESGFSDVGARLDRMDQRLTMLETCVERQAEKLRRTIQKTNQQSTEEIEELRAEFDRGLYDVKKETEDIIDVRVEDELDVARGELEDYIKDEVASIEGRLESKFESSLENAQVSLEFNWNR